VVNKWALGCLAGVVACITVGIKSWLTILKILGTPDASWEFPLFLLFLFCICGAITFSLSGMTSLQNYPSKYVPSGTYHVLYDTADEEGILVTLVYLCSPESMERRKEIKLKNARTFFVPLQWFRPGGDLYGPYLVCERVSGHPVILVSRDFYEKYCKPAKSEGATQAA
jgi:hypothetical protein